MIIWLAIAIGTLFAGAVYLLLRRNVVKLILGLAMLGYAVNLLIFTMGDGVRRGVPPLLDDPNGVVAPGLADPLPQALILTAIVISFGLLAFVMALAYRATQSINSDNLDEMTSTDQL